MSFENVRREKLRKYHPLKEWLTSEGGMANVSLHPFIVGALGSWDAANDEFLKALQIGANYSKPFRKLCVTDAIKGLKVIWQARSSQ